MKRPLLLTAVLLGSLAIAGCAASQAPTDDMPAKNLEQWALPLDQFASQTSGLRSYVENLMISDCLGKQGIDWPAPWQPLDAPAVSPSYTAGGARLFDEVIAAKYGYHRIPLTYKGKDQQREAFKQTSALVQRDPSVGEKSYACLTEARQTIPVPPMDDYNYATVAASSIYSTSLRDAGVLAATGEWRTCMGSAGFGGLADSPAKMPGDVKSQEWKLGDPSDAVPISPDEIRTATADAKCRDSSGWSRALYGVEYRKQVAFVKKNADKLNRIRQELTKDKDRLLAAATKYAPK